MVLYLIAASYWYAKDLRIIVYHIPFGIDGCVISVAAIQGNHNKVSGLCRFGQIP